MLTCAPRKKCHIGRESIRAVCQNRHHRKFFAPEAAVTAAFHCAVAKQVLIRGQCE